MYSKTLILYVLLLDRFSNNFKVFYPKTHTYFFTWIKDFQLIPFFFLLKVFKYGSIIIFGNTCIGFLLTFDPGVYLFLYLLCKIQMYLSFSFGWLV